MGDNGAYKSPQWLLPNNENKDKVSNYSLSFDGMGDYVSLNSSIDLGINSTISLWVNFDAAYNGILLGEDSYSSDYFLYPFSTGFYVRIASVFKLYTNVHTYLTAGSWHHLAVVRSGDSVEIFVDGFSRETQTGFGAAISTKFDTIAAKPDGTLPLEGKIDEIAVWDNNTVSISDIYNGGTPTTIPSGAVAHYKMGEEANFTSNWLIDNSALTNYSKRSFQFDGMDDYINIGNGISFEYTDAFSYSFWVKPNAVSGAKNLYTKYDAGRGIYTYLNSASGAGANTLYFFLLNTNSGSTATRKRITTNTGAIISPNVWTNIVITYDGSGLGSGINVYKNGVPQTVTITQDNLQNNTILNSSDSYISAFNGASSFFTGGQDEFAIYSTELSSDDALAIYNGGEPTTISGAVAHYRMGEDASFNGTNWTVPDQVGTNNGTSNAMMVDALVGEAPNYSGGGISNAMTIEDRIGEAPNSENNVLSYNMVKEDRVEETP